MTAPASDPPPHVTAASDALSLRAGSGVPGVSDLIAASWERSRDAGVDAAQPHRSFTDDINTGSLLVRCAQPVLEQLEIDTADLPLVIALSDKKARIVQRIDCSSVVGQLLDQVQFAPGFDCSEAALGTNGIGTVLEAGQPISVVGSEHFTENLRMFACTGAPIIDPVTRRIEGVLDITSLAQAWSPLIPTLIKNAAKDISRNLLLDRNQSQRAIFETYLRVAARSARHAVFAFGDTLFIASPCAQQMFDASEQQVLREHATFLMTHKEHAGDTLALPGRKRLVHLWGTRIFAGSEVAGIVVTAELVSSRRTGLAGDFAAQASPQIGVTAPQPAEIADAPFCSHGSLAGGRSPAWVRACGELRAALENKQPALLVGETGVGKSTLVIELFHSIYPNAHSIAVDAAQIGAEVTPSDISSLVSNRSEPTLHIVRDIDQASPDEVEKLEEYFSVVESLDGPAWIVATVSQSPPSSDLPCCELLSHFDTTITVPPLRCRTDDLPAITATLLHTIAPKHKIRVSPAAQRLISRYSWPRNISQLREALAHAVRRRPVGEIQDDDLPGYCQTGSRRALTPLETIERDAIVAALQNVAHNRVAAATQLGMSRSSLYRKLKTYGITA